jgi:hypothetical protein
MLNVSFAPVGKDLKMPPCDMGVEQAWCNPVEVMEVVPKR